MFNTSLPPKGHGVKTNPVRPNPEIENTGEQIIKRKKEDEGKLIPPDRNIQRARIPFQYASRALESWAKISTQPTTLRHLIGFTIVEGFLHTFNSDQPETKNLVHIVPVAGNNWFDLSLPEWGWHFQTGLTVGFSTQAIEWTDGGAIAWFNLVCDLNYEK